MSQQLGFEIINATNDVSCSVKNIPKYAQYYRIPLNDSQSPSDAVGRPIVHKSALLQTTGKSSGVIMNILVLSVLSILKIYPKLKTNSIGTIYYTLFEKYIAFVNLTPHVSSPGHLPHLPFTQLEKSTNQ